MKHLFISTLLFFACATIHAQQNNPDTKNKANPLTLKYPQGVTEETKKVDKCTIVTRTVVKGENAWVYVMKVFDFGVQCYKDGVTITPQVWEAETKSTAK